MGSKDRIESVDILRGITIAAMILVNTPGTWDHVYPFLLHAEWFGLTLADLVFPMFLFIVGISIFFSYKNKTNSIDTYKKIIIRSLKLIVLGFFLNIFLPYFPFFESLETVRIPNVLQRIGIVFLISSILYLNYNWKTILGVGIFILIGYWLFLGFMPFPNINGISPTFERASNNWANYIDLKILGQHMWQADYDPEGVLSTIPSIVSCLYGILIGNLLASKRNNILQLLVFVSIALILIGLVCDLWFPISKAIWSSSYVIITSGIGTLILSIVYYITDVKEISFGSVFKYVGMNAITVYFLSMFIGKIFELISVGQGNSVHSYLFETLFVHDLLPIQLSSMLYALIVTGFYLFLGYFMYKRKIFIKV